LNHKHHLWLLLCLPERSRYCRDSFTVSLFSDLVCGQIITAQGTSNAFAGLSSRQSILPHPPPQTPVKSGPPRTPVRSYHLEESSSPAKNIEFVGNFLLDRAGQTISDVEVEGLLSLLNKSTPRA
jgi:hypothetical protein